MNGLMTIGVLLSTVLAQAPAPAAPPAGGLKLRIGTSTYLSDGQVLTASANDWKLVLNQPVVAYATSGKSMCQTRPATAEAPADAGLGWRIEATPIRMTATELEVRVVWTPMSWTKRQTAAEHFAFDKTPVAGRVPDGTVLTLHPGDRVLVDYLGPGDSLSRGFIAFKPMASKDQKVDTTALRSRLAFAGAAAADPSCKAVGMALEIGVEPAKSLPIVEAELWLVRPDGKGAEQSERQVVRLPIGQPAASYYFDEKALMTTPQRGPLDQLIAKVTGDLSAVSVDTSGIHLNLTLTREYEVWPAFAQRPGNERTTRAAYRDLVATPGEVLAFKLPAIQVPVIQTDLVGGTAKQNVEVRPWAELSVRLRAQVLR